MRTARSIGRDTVAAEATVAAEVNAEACVGVDGIGENGVSLAASDNDTGALVEGDDVSGPYSSNNIAGGRACSSERENCDPGAIIRYGIRSCHIRANEVSLHLI